MVPTTLSLYVKGSISTSSGAAGGSAIWGASTIRDLVVKVLLGRGATVGTSLGRGDCTGSRSWSVASFPPVVA